MRQMTESEWRAFVTEGTRTGKLALTRADGRPHVTPVWFVLDGPDLVFTTAATSVKGRTLSRDPRAGLCVDDQRPPFSYVMVEGTVTLSTDPADLLHWATEIGARYMGPDRGREFGERNGVPGELLVRLHPTKIVAFTDISA